MEYRAREVITVLTRNASANVIKRTMSVCYCPTYKLLLGLLSTTYLQNNSFTFNILSCNTLCGLRKVTIIQFKIFPNKGHSCLFIIKDEF